jgi:uncharacterized protein (DUF58 family)
VLGTDEVIVLPRVHEILPPPRVGGDEPDLDAPPRHDRTQHHGEFLTLRPYQVGDDLRRVHWRSTARRDQLMIRQDESQPRTPVVVMLDVRPGAHDRPSFERAVEAVASLVAALERAGRPVTLVASTGARLGTPGRRHLASVLDELAVIEPHGADRVEVGRLGPRGLLVAVVGRLGTEDLDALGALTRGGSTLAVVDTRSTHAPVLPRRGRTPLVVGAGDEIPFPRAWNEAVLRWQQSRAPRSRPPSPSPA